MTTENAKESFKEMISKGVASGEISPNKGVELYNFILKVMEKNSSIKTLEEIKDDLAKEYGEEHFDALLQSKISIGYLPMAKKLLDTSTYRYLIQFK